MYETYIRTLISIILICLSKSSISPTVWVGFELFHTHTKNNNKKINKYG